MDNLCYYKREHALRARHPYWAYYPENDHPDEGDLDWLFLEELLETDSLNEGFFEINAEAHTISDLNDHTIFAEYGRESSISQLDLEQI